MVWKILEGTVGTLIVGVLMAIVGLLGYLLLLAIPNTPATAAVWTTLLVPVLFAGIVSGAILYSSRR